MPENVESTVMPTSAQDHESTWSLEDETLRIQSIVSVNNKTSTLPRSIMDTPLPASGSHEDLPVEKEQLLEPPAQVSSEEIALPISLPVAPPSKKTEQKSLVKKGTNRKHELDIASAQVVRERCRQLCLSLFFRERDPVRSLGFTSSVRGEGKTFMSIIAASTLAQDSNDPVTLVECNWEHPYYHEHFGFSSTPGLAEWLRGECIQSDIRHKVDHNLTVIPAGDARGGMVKLLTQLRQKGLLNAVARSNELLIVDLPSIVVSAYGPIAAGLVESLIVVVRAGVTSETLLAESCSRLRDLPVHGLMLNQLESHIPRWLRQLL